MRTLGVAAFLWFTSVMCVAGGPAFVAGSGYDPGVMGQPLVWANASVQYFSDQGNLSPILSAAQADAFVASAIASWTGAPGVGLTASYSGHLAEDVNGSNIQATVSGVITAPADITPSATATPLGIVYDYDGKVNDAVLGLGAGGPGECFSNAVYGGPDNFSAGGNITHALVIINGVCASVDTQLPEVQYRLVRVLGRVFGLGWSQANLNVQTRNPAPGPADYAGFPVMHFMDLASCVPISNCYPNAAAPKMDDLTALARLYPASGGPSSGRIWGNVYFTDSSGNATQPMQGVNVVARLMESGQPSRQYVVTSVSGFEFAGNAGNMILGYVDSDGLRFDRFGSNDPALEGFYDLGQLMIPSGHSYAQYQLSVEAIDPIWSWGVQPYSPTEVLPSGLFSPVVVTVTSGSNAERDILMLGSAVAQKHPGSGSSYENPQALPKGGGWGSWISGYNSADWFQFTARADRTASVAVTALDEAGKPSESKLLPVIGIWQLSDNSKSPAPASTPSAFNSTTFATTRLDAIFHSTETYRLGVADYRGDGRPDYSYQASVLYADTASPSRLSVAGGVTTLQGTGFKAGLRVAAGGNNGTVLSHSANTIQAALPGAALDGTATVQVSDPLTGSTSQMIGALIYGAAPDDKLQFLQNTEPATPVGAQAANVLRVRATAADGVTPVNGATIVWGATNGARFSACGASSCSVLSDESGEASTWVTPTAPGQSTISAALAPASYPSPPTQLTTLLATQTTLDLAAIAPTRWIAQGVTISVPLTVKALSSGVPKANVAVSYAVTQGTASLSSATATTNSAGLATVTAQLTNFAANVQVIACVSPGNNPCQTFTLFATPSSMWTLERVAGTKQVMPYGQSFQPLVMRVTDGSAVDNPVLGANVTFSITLERDPQGPGGPPLDDSYQGGSGMPVILATSQTQVMTDENGLASIVPTAGNFGPCDVSVTITAGSAMAQLELQVVEPNAEPTRPVHHVPLEPSHHARHGASRATAQAALMAPLLAMPELVPTQRLSSDLCREAQESVEAPAECLAKTPESSPTETTNTNDTQPCASPTSTDATPSSASASPPLTPTVKSAVVPRETESNQDEGSAESTKPCAASSGATKHSVPPDSAGADGTSEVPAVSPPRVVGPPGT